MESLASTPEWRRNKELAEQEFRDGVTRVAARPSWITYDPGSICNLKCVQCPRENPTTPFTEVHADPDIVGKIRQSMPYLRRLSLYGLGEPLLSSVFWDLIEDSAVDTIPVVDINSNGTLFSEKNVNRLLASRLNCIRVSIDGARHDTYKRIRAGNLQKVIDGVRRLTRRRRELGRDDFKVWIAMTLMLENIRELPEMVELAHELDVDVVWAEHLIDRSDDTQAKWRLERKNWTFDYNAQRCLNDPELTNAMVAKAAEIAERTGVVFDVHEGLLIQAVRS